MDIALAGIGKIARDQHIPSIAASPDWTLAATVSRHGTVDGVPAWTGMEEMLRDRRDIATVSLCLPPVPRFEAAKAALEAGRHVMLEKPPGATLAECHALEALAREKGVALFATWHSREGQAVDAARDWLRDRIVQRAHITWHEDVRRWHPGQDWVFEPGGMGVFDPGINALSILTKILPAPVHLKAAVLDVPENRQTPIAARLDFTQHVTADFDWRREGDQLWRIEVVTAEGTLRLDDGGARMSLDGEAVEIAEGPGEYPRLYARMAELVRQGGIDMDLSPLVHVADALMLGERRLVEAFEF